MSKYSLHILRCRGIYGRLFYMKWVKAMTGKNSVVPNFKLDKLPFTTYDIIGYLTPGIFSIWLTSYLFPNINSTERITSFFHEADAIPEQVIVSLSCLAIFYTIGHIISLVSSLLIERFLLFYFGYPSKFFVLENKINNATVRNIVKHNIQKNWRTPNFFFTTIMLFPIFPYLIICYIIGAHGYYVKRLDRSAADILISRFKKITRKNIQRNIEENDANWFRVVEYTVYRENPLSTSKMYNYVVMYGFLRSICLILITVTWYCLIKAIFMIVTVYPADWNLASLYECLIFSLITFFVFVGFAKFFRRYSEEAIWAFIAEYQQPAEPRSRPA